MGLAHSIRTLIETAGRYLAGLDGEASGIAQVCEGLEWFGRGPVNALKPDPVPACGFLDEALAACDAAEIAGAIGLARPHLAWTAYDLYPRDEIGPRWPGAHAMASLVGETGFVHAQDYELGLFLMAPRTLYRDHHHPAPELYAPLTGPHGWRFGTSAPWVTKPAHAPVWNEPNAVHATLVRDVPFLCLYGWTRDVNLPAKVDLAGDWAAIEAAL